MDIVLRNILDLIEKNNLTDVKFQEDLHFYKTMVAEWKSGKTKSYIKHLPVIAEYFKVSIDSITGNSHIKEKPPTETAEGEEIKFENLSDDEKKFILNFHKLSEEDRALLLNIAKKMKD